MKKTGWTRKDRTGQTKRYKQELMDKQRQMKSYKDEQGQKQERTKKTPTIKNKRGRKWKKGTRTVQDVQGDTFWV